MEGEVMTSSAIEILKNELRKPVPTKEESVCIDFFDPWEAFPLYGSYSDDFDKCAIDVLQEIRIKKKNRDDLGAEMFREILCSADLCDYGTSPRVCFANKEFMEILDELIEKWKAYSAAWWKD